VSAVSACPVVDAAGLEALAVDLRVAKRAYVLVADARAGERLAERRFRESAAAGDRDLADVDDPPYPGAGQALELEAAPSVSYARPAGSHREAVLVENCCSTSGAASRGRDGLTLARRLPGNSTKRKAGGVIDAGVALALC
jgi:hypothetical protein